MKSKIRIGSRGSDLALWQAHFFQDALKEIGVDSEIIIIKTKGDRIQQLSFNKIEGKGFFTKEIEEALLQGEVDVAIHSHKDLETQNPPGLTLAGLSYREDPSELLLIRKECTDPSLPLGFKKNAIVGTSSARRKSQVKALRPDITIKDIRGNVPTRIDKLRSGDFDAILLAHAGVHRLQLDTSDLHTAKLDPRLFIPAPAQGVLAYQCREADSETIKIVQQLHRPDVADAIHIERGILKGFGGGCHIPIGVYARPNSDGFSVWATFGSNWENIPSRVRFSAKDPVEALDRFASIKQSSKPKSVFISRSLTNESFFVRACKEHNISVTAASLISIEPKAFEISAGAFDWVVFSSSNGVRAFFAQEEPSEWKHVRFATAGQATLQTLSEFGIAPTYAGHDSDMTVVAKELAANIGESQALFPSAKDSLGSLQEHLSAEQVTEVTVYETQLKSQNIDSHDAYVFTSPSNVQAFIDGGNTLADHATVVAIGPSTGQALESLTDSHLTAEIPSEAELFALLASRS